MPSSSPHASIVLLCYGKWHLTERCLGTIVDSLGDRLGDDFELVIVDNGSKDETPQRLREWADRAVVVSLAPNREFSGGCNAGANAASGEVLIFLNNDTLVRPGVFEELVAEALDPTVGAVGLRLLYPDLTLQHGGVAWYRDDRERFHSFHLFRYQAGDLAAASAPLDLEVVTGACLAIRRGLYFELGGFDEGYRSGFEDVDLCLKVRLSGRRVVYRGDLWMIHDEGLTRGRNADERDNWSYLHSRWGSLLEDDGDLIATAFDAQFSPVAVYGWTAPANPWGSQVSVEGQVGGLSRESAEARTLLAGLERAGLAPAAREWQQTWIWPRLDEREQQWLVAELSRSKQAGALVVHVPVGRWCSVPAGAAHVVRLAAAPTTGLPPVAAVWAASEELAEDLVASGLSAEQVDVLPPLLPEVAAGPGGEGVLAILPAEALADADRILCALAACGDAPVRLLPTVASPKLAGLARARLPRAELLGPVSTDQGLAALAAVSDVVVCGAASDVYGRAALLSAAAGAVPVCVDPGAAAGVLGGELVLEDDLVVAVERALAGTAGRERRAALVAEACSSAAAAPRLAELVAKARELVAGSRDRLALPGR